MKILILGAGVMGCLYAAKLKQAGFDVTLLARGQRLKQLKNQGLTVKDAFTQKEFIVTLSLAETLKPLDEYDLVAVHVKGNQLSSVVSSLSANKKIKTILFMLNYPAGIEEVVAEVGSQRCIIGFPGGGGWIDEHGVLHASVAPGFAQPTIFGKLDQKNPLELTKIAQIYYQAGFPVTISTNIDAWLKTHVTWTLPKECMLYKFNLDPKKIADDPKAVKMVLNGIRDGMNVLKALQIPLTPVHIKIIFDQSPAFIGKFILRWWLNSKNADVYTVRHTKSAPDEAKFLSKQFQKLIVKSSLKTPNLNQLYSYSQSS